MTGYGDDGYEPIDRGQSSRPFVIAIAVWVVVFVGGLFMIRSANRHERSMAMVPETKIHGMTFRVEGDSIIVYGNSPYAVWIVATGDTLYPVPTSRRVRGRTYYVRP